MQAFEALAAGEIARRFGLGGPGHIAEIAANDWLDPAARGRDRGESAAWIGELLADPHSRLGLRALLDAVDR